MKLNPYLTAALASSYIGATALFIHFISGIRHDTPDTIIDGMAFISLFVFSAAVMAFIFFYQPTILLIANKKEEAITYFLKTLGTFGAITILVLIFVSMQ
jgi:hypothetical protein